MAQAFSLEKNNVSIKNTVCTPSDFVNNEFITDELTVGNFEGVSVTIEYKELNPDGEDANGNTQSPESRFRAILETQDDAGQWTPLAAQLSSHKGTPRAGIRVLTVQPDMVNIDQGVENIVPGANDTELARITREQGHVGSKIRVRLLKEDIGNPALPFVSMKLSMHGLLY